MIAQASPVAAFPAAPPLKNAPAHGPSLFHQILSELNPLQYLPVIGTIYRAVTGDTIPEAARMAGSLVVSGLTGGPIGMAMNLGATMAEHLLGIDPEKLGARLLADIGIGSASGAAAPAQAARLAASVPGTAHAVAALPAPSPPASFTPVTTDSPLAVPRGWSVAQLAAYGVKTGSTSDFAGGSLSGADVLNTLELARLKAGTAIA